MINKKLNLSLNLGKSLNNLSSQDGGPFTPLEQTLKTPVDQPFHGQQQFPFPVPGAKSSFYAHPHYNESDDILNNADDPNGSSKTTKHYTLNFTPKFDQLVMSIYSNILSLPTTTPFQGTSPPSGIVNKVANETMSSLIANISSGGASFQGAYDCQSIINSECLNNTHFQPILLQLIRKRLIELCIYNNTYNGKLPHTTTISVSSSGNNNIRQSSISNLSVMDLNISNHSQSSSQNRSRSSSMSLRKQSLTRNNSYTGNSWLHVGKLNNIRPPYINENCSNSSESLQSMQDFVPQALISKSATNSNSHLFGNRNGTPGGFNPIMMDYQNQTPPGSSKGSFSSGMTPPSNIQIIHQTNAPDIDDVNVNQYPQRQGTTPKNNFFSNPLTINTEYANQPYSTNGSFSQGNSGLDSPFMSATTPSDEYGYFPNTLHKTPSNSSDMSSEDPISDSKVSLPAQISLSEKKRDSLKMKRGIH